MGGWKEVDRPRRPRADEPRRADRPRRPRRRPDRPASRRRWIWRNARDGLHWAVDAARVPRRPARGDRARRPARRLLADGRRQGPLGRRHPPRRADRRTSRRLSREQPRLSGGDGRVPRRPNHNQGGRQVSEEAPPPVPAEEARTEDTRSRGAPTTSARTARKSRSSRAGTGRSRSRTGRRRCSSSLTDAFKQRGFPAETATLEWGEARTLTFGGSLDDLTRCAATVCRSAPTALRLARVRVGRGRGGCDLRPGVQAGVEDAGHGLRRDRAPWPPRRPVQRARVGGSETLQNGPNGRRDHDRRQGARGPREGRDSPASSNSRRRSGSTSSLSSAGS